MTYRLIIIYTWSSRNVESRYFGFTALLHTGAEAAPLNGLLRSSKNASLGARDKRAPLNGPRSPVLLTSTSACLTWTVERRVPSAGRLRGLVWHCALGLRFWPPSSSRLRGPLSVAGKRWGLTGKNKKKQSQTKCCSRQVTSQQLLHMKFLCARVGIYGLALNPKKRAHRVAILRTGEGWVKRKQPPSHGLPTEKPP